MSVYCEATVYCPVCHALETLDMDNGCPVPNSHWHLTGAGLYHRDCGVPCSVFPEHQV